MGWKLKTRPKTLRVTKSLVKQFIEMEAAPHDRPLSERRLSVYQKLWEAGQFRPVTWASAYCRETGGTYRVNGKHTSIMLSRQDPVGEFYVVLEEYICDTLEDVAKLYATFDSKMQSRNSNDIYLSFAATLPELATFSQKTIVCAVTGIAYHKFGQDLYSKTQPAERAELILEHPEFVEWLGSLYTGGLEQSETGWNKKCGHLQRLPVAAAMFGCWLRDPVAATQFWNHVRDETGPDPKSPDRRIARYLMTTVMRSTSRDINDGKAAGNREIYVKCIHSWNAWRKGTTTSLKYYSDKPIPEVT